MIAGAQWFLDMVVLVLGLSVILVFVRRGHCLTLLDSLFSVMMTLTYQIYVHHRNRSSPVYPKSIVHDVGLPQPIIPWDDCFLIQSEDCELAEADFGANQSSPLAWK
jgi:hypothetical protein